MKKRLDAKGKDKGHILTGRCPNAFKFFFENIVWQCAQAGLIDGSKIFTDASLVQADASNNSVVNQHSLNRYLNKSFRELENRLEKQPESEPQKGAANRKYISTTDPDASLVRMGPGRSRLRYKTHRAVDEKYEVITATDVSAGEKNEAHFLAPLIDQHQANTGQTVTTAVADSKYGTIDNYLACYDRNILPHFEYSLPAKICNKCPLKPQCTRSKQGRTIKRHIRQDELNKMLTLSQSRASKRDIHKRQYLMERSFARSMRYGYKRARWRRLWRVQIQEYLTAAIQNIMVLVRYSKEQNRTAQAKLPKPRPKRPSLYSKWSNIKSLLKQPMLSLAFTTELR